MFPDSEIAIEHGFSINKEVLDTNMSEKTIVAQRMICDSVNKELSIEGSKDVSKIKIDKEMLRYCSKASSAYKVYLSEKHAKNSIFYLNLFFLSRFSIDFQVFHMIRGV